MAHSTDGHDNDRLEHANVTVENIDRALTFLMTALPSWRVRGGGTMDWFGKTIRWVHVGTDEHYLALQGGGEGDKPDWKTHRLGVKHLGFVVADLDAVVHRLAEAGFPVDHYGPEHPHRRRVYFSPDDLVQAEFIQYLSDVPSERHSYAD